MPKLEEGLLKEGRYWKARFTFKGRPYKLTTRCTNKEAAREEARKIRERSRKRLLTIRIEGWMVDRAKKIAKEKRIPYQRLLREWIGQGMQHELRSGRKRLKA
jgi:predicted DNA binding CopG/RHH family protein